MEQRPDLIFERRVRLNKEDKQLQKIRDEYTANFYLILDLAEKNQFGSEEYKRLIKLEKKINRRGIDRQQELGIYIRE